MEIRLLTWRLPDYAVPAPDAEAAVMVALTDEPNKETAEMLADPAWGVVSHNVTYDPDGPILTVLFRRR